MRTRKIARLKCRHDLMIAGAVSSDDVQRHRKRIVCPHKLSKAGVPGNRSDEKELCLLLKPGVGRNTTHRDQFTVELLRAMPPDPVAIIHLVAMPVRATKVRFKRAKAMCECAR